MISLITVSRGLIDSSHLPSDPSIPAGYIELALRKKN